MITRPVRLYESALRDVRYVFGRPVQFPLRARFEKAETHAATVEAHKAAKAAAVQDEEALEEMRRAA
jgi:hypothetical protein